MTTKSTQWGTAIYESEGEVPLSGSASGLGRLRLKGIRIARGIRMEDLPDPLAFDTNVAGRTLMGGEVSMSPEMFGDLLGALATAKAMKQAVEASGYEIPGFANLGLGEDCDDGDPCDDDMDDDGYVMPSVSDATATLIEYENRIESTNPVGGLATLNRIFAEGWEFQCQVGPDLILLKRRKG